MKKALRHKILLWFMLSVALFSTIPTQSFAVSGSIAFTPNGGPVIAGSTFTVEVRGNVGRPPISGGATIGVTYPTNLLQATSASSSGGALGGTNPTISSGTVSFTVFNFIGRAVNDQMIFKITFKALTPGQATLNFTSNTNINDGPTTKQPATFSIHSPTCPSGQIGTPPNCTTPPAPSPQPTPRPTNTPRPSVAPPRPTTPRPSVAPTPVPTPVTPEPSVEELLEPTTQSQGSLKIENVRITANRQKNSVSWQLNNPDNTELKLTYGTTKGNQKNEAVVTKLSDGTYESEFTDTKMGTLYFFTIKATSSNQMEGATHTGTLTTRGYPVQLTIQQNGVLAPGAKVQIGQRNFTANKNAIITTELGEGAYEASITPVGSTETLKVQFTVQKKPIPATGNPELQSFTLNGIIDGSAAAQDDTAIMTLIGSILAGILGVGGLIVFLLYRKRQLQAQNDTATIDADALAIYGSSLQTASNMTPEPNLQATGNLNTSFDDYAQPVAYDNTAADPSMTAAPAPEAYPAAPVEAPEYQQPTTTVELAYSAPQEEMQYPQEPIPEPQPIMTPPTDYVQPNLEPTPYAVPDTNPTQTDYAATTYAEPTPSTASETSDASLDQSPSAIYDATTGELAILHNREPAPAPINQTQLGEIGQ